MLSVGEGSKKAAVDQIRQLGATNVIVRSMKPGANGRNLSNNTGSSSSTNSSSVLTYGLKYEDLRVLEGLMDSDGVDAAPSSSTSLPFHSSAKQPSIVVIASKMCVLGTVPELMHVKNLQLDRGRFIDSTDLRDLSNVIVLSQGAARRLFGFADPLGQPVLIGEVPFAW